MASNRRQDDGYRLLLSSMDLNLQYGEDIFKTSQDAVSTP